MTSSWAEFLQRWSSPATDTLAYAITCLGSELFYTLTLPVIYWVWSKRIGYRLGVTFLISMWLNSALKHAFEIPRPLPTERARVIHPETGGGYAFPSGHAQGSATFWGHLGTEVKSKWFRVAACVLVFLVSLSRVYLNVHWPSDVVGGVLIGSLVVWCGSAVARRWARVGADTPVRLGVSLAIPAGLYLIHRTEDVLMVLGLLAGLSVGSVMEEKLVGWSERAPFLVQCGKVMLGMGGFLGLRFLLKLALPQSAATVLFRYAAGGFWVSFCAPWLFRRLGWSGT